MTAVQCYTACSVSVWYWPCQCQWWRKHGPLPAHLLSLYQPHGSCWPVKTKKMKVKHPPVFLCTLMWTFWGVFIPGWSSWADCLETEQLSKTSRGLGGYEMRQQPCMRCLLWNPPSPLKCYPPSGFRRIQLTCIREVRKLSWVTVFFFVFFVKSLQQHTQKESGWSQTLQPRNICW